jgi:hypothetical protein
VAVRVSELRGSERCPVIGQIEVASARWDKITSPETELTSRWLFKLENICGTDVGSKANDGGASRWCSFPHDGGFLHRRASWPQISIEKVLFDVE